MRNKMLTGILAICITSGCFSTASAQDGASFIEPGGFSLGTNIGLLDLWSDIGTKNILDHYTNSHYFDKPTFMGGLFIRYSAAPAFAIRLGLNYGTLYATDKWNEDGFKKATTFEDDAYQRYIRNQDVKANILDGILIFEVMPLRLGIDGKTARKKMQPYILFGVSGFYSNPKTTYVDRNNGNTKYVPIHDLNLEGQGMGFEGAPETQSKLNMSIPLGLGVKWDLGYQLAFGVEYQYRYCFSDYLDGVSNNYIDPKYFDANLSPKDADLARSVYDKSFQINENITHNPGDKRGNPAVADGFSTFSLIFYYKINRRIDRWWE